MADGSNKFKNSINLKPQSSDPSNPAEGDVFRSDGTSRTKGLWEYKDNVWTQIGSGAGGGTTINLGATITAWESFTPTGTWTTNTTYTGEKRRIGDSISFKVKVATSGAPTAGGLFVDIPDSLTIDTSKLTDTSNGHSVVGKVSIVDSSSGTVFSGNARYYTDSQIRIDYYIDNSGLERFGGVSNTAPITFASGDKITIEVSNLPIAGWSVADIPTSTDGVVVRGADNGGTSLTASTTDIDFTEVEDTTSSWNGTQFTAPETANYSISGSVNFTTTANRFISAYIDGTLSKILGAVTLSSGAFYGEVKLNQGEVLSIRSEQTGTLLSSSTFHHIHIQRLGFNTIINREGTYKNYMEPDNSSIEEDIGDWVAYADAAATTPEDGVDGSPTITATRNTTAALRGTGDLLFTKDAANRQGEGISCPFVIDIADRAKKLTISFDYSTSANYADGDVKIFIYDLTNSNLIRVNGEDLKAVSGQSTHYAQFQTAPDSTNYRLIIHQSTDDLTAYTINLDNLRVGPTALAKGAIITDWESFTPTVKGTTTDPSLGGSFSTAKYRRVGSNLEIQLEYSQSSAGAAGSGGYYFELPAGLSLDSSVNSNTPNVQGYGAISLGTSSRIQVSPRAYFGGIGLFLDNSTSSTSDWTSSGSYNFGVTALRISTYVSVPIQGWSSEAVMSEDLGGRDIRVQAFGAAGTSITAGNDIDWATTTEDTTASWNGTQFTAPESGSYDIEGIIRSVSNQNHSIRAYIDNGGDKFFAVLPTSDDRCKFSGKIYLNKGEVLSFRNTATFTPVSDANLHWIYIEKEASPQTILETETVAARYNTTSAQSIDHDTNTTVVYNTLTADTHNAMNTTTGVYTIPVSGWYHISANVTYSALSVVAGTFTSGIIRINDSFNIYRNSKEFSGTNSTSVYSTPVSTIYYLEKGDTVEIQTYQSSGGSENLAAQSERNVFSIARIK